MASGHSSSQFVASGAREFRTTHWSVVVAAQDSNTPQSAEALAKLCRVYWYPLYAYVRRQGRSPEDAQDLTQGFFARFLEKEYFKRADRTRGRFRTFLLSSLKNFLSNESRRATRPKRGGGQLLIPLDAEDAEGRYAQEPADESSPDKLYEKRWAATLLVQAMERVREEFCATGRQRVFDELKVFVWGDRNAVSQIEVAKRLGMSEGAVNLAVHRLRRRYRERLREEIAHTVDNPAEIDEELRHLKAVLSG